LSIFFLFDENPGVAFAGLDGTAAEARKLFQIAALARAETERRRWGFVQLANMQMRLEQRDGNRL
jgi:hypothetical protein